MRAISFISRVMGYVSGFVLSAMMLITVVDIFMRYLFSQALTGTSEVVEYMMVCMVFFGLAWCALKGRHITVDLVVSRLSPKAQAIVDIITYVLGLCLCFVLSWHTFLESLLQHRAGFTSQFLKVPTYPFYVVIALGFAMLFLAILSLLVRKVAELLKG